MSDGTRFCMFTDAELSGLAQAMDAAAGEGAYGDREDVTLAHELAQEFKRRGLRIPHSLPTRIGP